ncbi:MAG TPA: DUF4440 domain-containing protein [Gemmatimonadaceae bacterium]|nr:DUF4440 domain-containing protein [Gemmatimonadaceae bacterium]
MMRSWALLPLLLAAAACAPGARGTHPVTPSPRRLPEADSLRRLIAQAKFALDSAARAGDAAFAARLLTADADVTQHGERLAGVGGVAAWLTGHSAGARISTVQLLPERILTCTTGAVEREGHYLVALERAGVADTLRGRYTMEWTLQPDGSLRVAQAAFAADGSHAPPSRSCPSLTLARARARRVGLWLLPPRLGAVQLQTADRVEKALRADGYGGGRLFTGANVMAGHEGSEYDGSTGIGIAAVRVRVAGPVSVEAMTSLRSNRARVQAYDPQRSSYVTFEHEEGLVGAIVSVERWGVRLGAGPMMLRGDSHFREEDLVLHEGTDFGGPSASYETRGVVADERWTSNSVVLAADVRYERPLTALLSVALMAQYHGGGSLELPDSDHLGPISVSRGGLSYGLAIGVTPF